MRMSFPIYKKSPGATVLSILGTCFTAIGILSLGYVILAAVQVETDDLVPQIFTCIMMTAFGYLLTYLAGRINTEKIADEVIKDIEQRGLRPQIASSYQLAEQVYNLAPGKKMLSYISSLNPQFAAQIQQKSKHSKNKSKTQNINNQNNNQLVSFVERSVIPEQSSSIYTITLNTGYGWNTAINCVKNLALQDLNVQYLAVGSNDFSPEDLTSQIKQSNLNSALDNISENGVLFVGGVSRSYNNMISTGMLIYFYNQTNIIKIKLINSLDDKTEAVRNYAQNVISQCFRF